MRKTILMKIRRKTIREEQTTLYGSRIDVLWMSRIRPTRFLQITHRDIYTHNQTSAKDTVIICSHHSSIEL